MNGFLLAIIWLGSIVIVGVCAKKKNRNVLGWVVFGIFLGPMGAIIGALMLRSGASENAKISKNDENEWHSLVQNLPYKHFHDGTGIAVDSKNKKLHLAGYFQAQYLRKSYDFSQVRE